MAAAFGKGSPRRAAAAFPASSNRSAAAGARSLRSTSRRAGSIFGDPEQGSGKGSPGLGSLSTSR